MRPPARPHPSADTSTTRKRSVNRWRKWRLADRRMGGWKKMETTIPGQRKESWIDAVALRPDRCAVTRCRLPPAAGNPIAAKPSTTASRTFRRAASSTRTRRRRTLRAGRRARREGGRPFDGWTALIHAFTSDGPHTQGGCTNVGGRSPTMPPNGGPALNLSRSEDGRQPCQDQHRDDVRREVVGRTNTGSASPRGSRAPPPGERGPPSPRNRNRRRGGHARSL